MRSLPQLPSAWSLPLRVLILNRAEVGLGAAGAHRHRVVRPVAQAEAVDQPAQRRQRPLLPLLRLPPALPRPASPTPPGTRSATTLTPTRRPACCQALRPPSRGPVLHLGPTILASGTSRPHRVPPRGGRAPHRAPTATAMRNAWPCGPRRARGCHAMLGPRPATKPVATPLDRPMTHGWHTDPAS